MILLWQCSKEFDRNKFQIFVPVNNILFYFITRVKKRIIYNLFMKRQFWKKITPSPSWEIIMELGGHIGRLKVRSYNRLVDYMYVAYFYHNKKIKTIPFFVRTMRTYRTYRTYMHMFSLEQITMVHFLFFTCYDGYKKIVMIQ